MAFELRPVAVGRPARRWSIPALVAALGVVAGAAFVTTGDRPPPRRQAADLPASGEADRLAVAAFDAAAATSQPARPMPDRVACRDLDRAACLRVARAALGAVPPEAPSILEITIWRSLLCSDDIECPSRFLADSVPLGSAVVRFADGGPQAAVNVVDWQPSAGIRLGPRAWLARWMPEVGGS
jgi:hypothetical protein